MSETEIGGIISSTDALIINLRNDWGGGAHRTLWHSWSLTSLTAALLSAFTTWLIAGRRQVLILHASCELSPGGYYLLRRIEAVVRPNEQGHRFWWRGDGV